MANKVSIDGYNWQFQGWNSRVFGLILPFI